MTRKEFYEVVKAAHLSDEEIVEICDKELAAIAKKAESEKKRRAEKAAEADELEEAVLGVLGEDPKVISVILDALGGETDDLTANKIAYRCSKLAEKGLAVKSEVTFELPPNGKKVKRVAYALSAE